MPRIIDSKSLPTTPDAAAVEKPVGEALAHVDARRVSGLQLLATVRVARNTVLAAQRARLVAEGGDAAAPQVRALDAEIETNRVTATQLTRQASRAGTPVPSVGADEWVLYGNVHFADATPAPGMTVALYAGGQRIVGLACDTTDANGRYLLRVPMNMLTRSGTTPVESISMPAADIASVPQGPTVTVRILDGKGTCLADPPDQFASKAGTSDYLDVELPAIATPPPPPPPPSAPPSPKSPTAPSSASSPATKRPAPAPPPPAKASAPPPSSAPPSGAPSPSSTPPPKAATAAPTKTPATTPDKEPAAPKTAPPPRDGGGSKK